MLNNKAIEVVEKYKKILSLIQYRYNKCRLQ